MVIFNNMFAPLNLSHNHNTRAAINYLLGQRPLILRIFCIQENHISKIFYPANISCFPRRLQGVFQDVFSVTLLVFQGVLKTSSKRFQDVFAISLRKTSSRRLQDIFKRSSIILKTSSRRLERQKNVTLKTSSVRLHQDECLLG